MLQIKNIKEVFVVYVLASGFTPKPTVVFLFFSELIYLHIPC